MVVDPRGMLVSGWVLAVEVRGAVVQRRRTATMRRFWTFRKLRGRVGDDVIGGMSRRAWW